MGDGGGLVGRGGGVVREKENHYLSVIKAYFSVLFS